MRPTLATAALTFLVAACGGSTPTTEPSEIASSERQSELWLGEIVPG